MRDSIINMTQYEPLANGSVAFKFKHLGYAMTWSLANTFDLLPSLPKDEYDLSDVYIYKEEQLIDTIRNTRNWDPQTRNWIRYIVGGVESHQVMDQLIASCISFAPLDFQNLIGIVDYLLKFSRYNVRLCLHPTKEHLGDEWMDEDWNDRFKEFAQQMSEKVQICT